MMQLFDSCPYQTVWQQELFSNKIMCNGLTSNVGERGIRESTLEVNGISCKSYSWRPMNLTIPLLLPL
jgi:hypothetical protein